MEPKVFLSPILLVALMVVLMSMLPFVAIFGGAAIVTGIGVAFILSRRSFKVPSIVPRDVTPTSEELDAVMAKYREEIEQFWRQWKTHH
jgi:hypothetical protein